MELDLGSYAPPSKDAWTGRVDAEAPREALRWHQVVELLDLTRTIAPGRRVDRGFCVVGYCCDEGVVRNHGRAGAARGPLEIRRQLANLPVGFSQDVALLDGGDVRGCDGGVERSQQALAALVSRLVAAGLFPVILGGGHDQAYGHFSGLADGLPRSTRLGVLSFDAHLDLRPTDRGASSGTSFSQIAALCAAEGRELHYLCIGAQRSANTLALFGRAHELGAGYVLARDIVEEQQLREAEGLVDRFLDKIDTLCLTVCADVMASAFVPGVSAPQPLGMHPETVLRLLKHVLASGKVAGFDIAEVSPRFDHDGATAKVAAILVYAVVEALLPESARLGVPDGVGD